jgi:hypothetical protein
MFVHLASIPAHNVLDQLLMIVLNVLQPLNFKQMEVVDVTLENMMLVLLVKVVINLVNLALKVMTLLV